MAEPTAAEWQALGELKAEALRLKRRYDRAKVSERNAMHRRFVMSEQYRPVAEKAARMEIELKARMNG